MNLCKLVKKQLDEKYTGDDLERLYGIILEDRRKRKGNNGKLKPIGDVDSYCDALLSRIEKLKHYKGQTTDILKIMVEYDNNGGVSA